MEEEDKAAAKHWGVDTCDGAVWIESIHVLVMFAVGMDVYIKNTDSWVAKDTWLIPDQALWLGRYDIGILYLIIISKSILSENELLYHTYLPDYWDL